MEKLKINEIILVEGRDDVTALKRVVDAHIITLNGFSAVNKKTLKKLEELSKTNEMILFTDPDFAGKKIRSVIESRIPKIKHAFISKKEATKVDNIGVENASDTSILEALKHVITHRDESTGGALFSASDLIDNGLTSGSNSKERRAKLGDILKIGYYNSKQLLKALNSFNISREQFEKAISEIDS